MDRVEVGEIFSISGDGEEEQEVEVLAVMNIENIEYAAISFLQDLEEESEEDIDIFFLKIDEEGDFAPIDTDEEFEKVSKAFDEVMDSEE